MVREPEASLETEIRVVAANFAWPEDLQTIFGTRGIGSVCQCQRYKLEPKESFASTPVEDRRQRLLDQTNCGLPFEQQTSGLVAYLDAEAVGWCAIEPRRNYSGLVRVFQVPWDGRDEDRTDPGVWAITCLFTRAGLRRRGISRAMAAAAVRHARERGATAVEAYPMVAGSALPEELHVGTYETFRQAGLQEVHRPTKRRAVMRLDIPR